MTDRLFFTVVAGWMIGLVATVVIDLSGVLIFHVRLHEGQLMLATATIMGAVVLLGLRGRV